MTTETWLTKLVEEERQLSERLRELVAGLGSGAVPEDQVDILLRQADAMRAYQEALQERIAAARKGP